MHALWDGFDLDRSVHDLQRLHRLAGSVNERSGETVRLLWPRSWQAVQRHAFDELRDEVHPYTKREVERFRKRRAQPAARRHAGHPSTPSHKGRSRSSAIAQDLEQFIRKLGPERLRERRRRELAAFHLSCAWANAGRAGDVRGWAPELAAMTGLDEAELVGTLQTLRTRVEDERAGRTTVFDGRELSPVYGYRPTTIVADLGITAQDAASAGLRLLVPTRDDAPLPANERSAAYRRRKGATPRTETKAVRLQHGMFVMQEANKGKTLAALAEELGRSLTYVRTALREAEFARPVVAGSSAARDSSRYLIAVRPDVESVADVPSVVDGAAPRFEPVGYRGTHIHRVLVLLAYQIGVGRDEVPYRPVDETVDIALEITAAVLAVESKTGKPAFPKLYSTAPELLIGSIANNPAVIAQGDDRQRVMIKPGDLRQLIKRNVIAISETKDLTINLRYC